MSRLTFSTPTPNLLYNQARILEQTGEFEGALGKYEQFVLSPNVDIEYRSEALERIKVLRETVKIKKGDTPAEPTAPNTRVRAPQTGSPSPPPQPEPKTNTAGVILLVSGGALLLGGGTMGVLASREEDAKEDATTLAQLKETSDRAGTFALIADGLFVGGGVLAGIGLLTFVLGGDDGDTQAQAYTLRPALGPRRAGVRFDFTF